MTSGTCTSGDGVGSVEWGRGAGGAYALKRVSWTVLVIPLGKSN